MPGEVKRKFVGENIRIAKSMKKPLTLISEILPKEYDKKILLEYYQKYYPYEWDDIVERCKVYREKDNFLAKNGKKRRYHMTTPEEWFYGLPKVKNILSDGVKRKHAAEFDENARIENLATFERKRNAAIEKYKSKIADNTKNLQHLDPLFLDLYDYAYHRRGVTQEEKLEIVNELFKYDTSSVVTLLSKINDAEHNDQIRNLVFKHLQDTGHYVKLRKKFKGKQKEYYTDTFDYNTTPADLVKRFDKKSLQDQKSYDLFISHSAKDFELIREIIRHLNDEQKTCYCDWMSDTDFLKRDLASDYTKEALKKRIEQSKGFLFIKTNNSMNNGAIDSSWIKLEIDYAKEIGKDMYVMDCTAGNTEYKFKKWLED